MKNLCKVHWGPMCVMQMHKKFEIIIRGCKKYDHALKLKRSTSQSSDSGNTVQHVYYYTLSYIYLKFCSSLEKKTLLFFQFINLLDYRI